MTEDTCDATTGDGQPCQNPAGDNGYCWIPSHNPNGDDDNPHGRPTIIDDVSDDVLEAAEAGASKEGCARAAGIHKSTLYAWITPESDRYDEEFHRDFMRARWQGEKRLLKNPDDVDSRHAQFILERSFKYTKEQTIEHEGDGLGDVVVSFTEDE